MKIHFITALIFSTTVAVQAFKSANRWSIIKQGSMTINDYDRGFPSLALYAKKRRSRATSRAKASSKPKPATLDSLQQQDKQNREESSTRFPKEAILGQTTIGGETVVVRDLSSVQKSDSKLDPLAGTSAAKKKAYEEESNDFERFIKKMTAPTPKGQEPEAVKLVKQITWGAVIVLVLIEIYVSVKVGGAPFDPSKATLPSLPDFKAFTGGAGPPELTPP